MKVLIVKTSSLGDVVHALPAVTDAQKNIPDINFDWVVEENFAEIPSWHPAIKNIIPVAWRRWRKNLIKSLYSGEILQFLKKLREEKYDLIIDAQGLIKSAVIASFARGVKVGYDKNSAREREASFFYKNKYAVSRDLHAITRIRHLFALALKYEIPNTVPVYGIDEKIFPLADNSEKYLVFFHGTSREEKCWSEQKWIELAEFAVTNGFIVYLPWGDNVELERAKRIAQKNQNQIRVLPKLKISAIAALIRSASGTVAVDTGLGHVAAAFGVPTVSLYGPTDPKLCGATATAANQMHLSNFTQVEAADVWQVMKKLTVMGHNS